MPQVIVIAGPNGAGKTTASRSLLSEALRSRTFVNADAIAQGLNGLDPDTQALQAGRLMLAQLHGLAANGEDFSFETTLSGRTYAKWLNELRLSGYVVELFYCWLNSPDLAVNRVAIRVKSGGHSIPEPTIRSRYTRSWNNFLELYQPLANRWQVVDNSDTTGHRVIAVGEETKVTTVNDPQTWDIFQQGPKS